MTKTIAIKEVEYEQPREGTDGAVCSTKYAWARVPAELTQDERAATKDKIRRLLKEKNAVMVSHYYVHPDLQDLAEETGGLVSDSLEMARFGRDDKLISYEQVLDTPGFARIKVGVSTQQDVLHTLGRPTETSYLALPKLHVWSYRYKESGVWDSMMHVHFDHDGIVRMMMNGPDPAKEERRFFW